MTADADEEPLFCVICGNELVGLPDDQPDWPTGPMCGDCYQARETDNDIWASELSDVDDADNL
jgi:hypothetical protein